ncbi:MAG: class I SAM-dependent methyltransferase [Acidobacteria bacterium]|nr:class I SAM-dependent methyltransferase [Acidobacteriota bacterium]
MDLRQLQWHWDTFGRQDPFWAILTDPARRGNRWSPEEFFETGRVEIAELLDRAPQLGVPCEWRRAMDFGCGAGRLTQALADRFDTVLGVDLAPAMIALARTHNRHGDRCTYEVNDEPNLSRWSDDTFDLIQTSRTLQHIDPRYSTEYVREFVRLLAPGGYLSFDLPSASGNDAALADGSVPPSAMRARIDITPSGPVDARPGQAMRFTVTVANVSDATWQDGAGRVLNVGNHWLDERGAIVQQDDVRVKLPTPLLPGARTAVDVVVTAPDAPGRHHLQFDVVQEGVAWFASCGSEPADVAVRVSTTPWAGPSAADTTSPVPDSAPPAAADGELEPVMEMHAVAREQVEAILRDCGARLLDVRRVHHCGPLWLAFRYDVTK